MTLTPAQEDVVVRQVARFSQLAMKGGAGDKGALDGYVTCLRDLLGGDYLDHITDLVVEEMQAFTMVYDNGTVDRLSPGDIVCYIPTNPRVITKGDREIIVTEDGVIVTPPDRDWEQLILEATGIQIGGE